MKLFDPESRPPHATAASFAPRTRHESHVGTGKSDANPSEWAPALHAADNALKAFRDAIAHRGDIPTVDDIPADDAPTHIIRDWILDVRRVIAQNPAGRILLADAQSALHSPTDTATYLNAIADQIAALHEMNLASGQRGTSSWALPSATSDIIHAWTSRRAWLAQVEYALNTETGSAACQAANTTPETVLRHASVYADLVDSATGRGLTASRKTITAQTGMSAKVEQRARRVLSALKLIVAAAVGRTLTTVEHLAAALHHGSSQSRAASTLHLTTPKQFAHIRPKPAKRLTNRVRTAKNSRRSTSKKPSRIETSRDHLSLSGLSPEEIFSLGVTHQTHASARGQNFSTTSTERPLHLQRAAAELLRRAPGLRNVAHIGSICHVLVTAGIDTFTWTGADIAAELDRDTRRRGWMWPAAITDPCALLAWRLRRIDWTGHSPSSAAQRAAERREQDRAAAAAASAERDRLAASASSRRSAIELFRAARSTQAVGGEVQRIHHASKPLRLRKMAARQSESADHRAAVRAELDAVRASQTSVAARIITAS